VREEGGGRRGFGDEGQKNHLVIPGLEKRLYALCIVRDVAQKDSESEGRRILSPLVAVPFTFCCGAIHTAVEGAIAAESSMSLNHRDI
jgi:hypothetical protein